jgi:hypothetical protein
MHADTDLAHADTLPVDAPIAALPQPRTRFTAATRGGTLTLQLDGLTAAHAAEAALLLDRCDALLDALDAWLHVALDWRWTVGEPAATASCVLAHTKIAAGDAALPCRLELPWPLLRALGAPPPALANTLQWGAVPAVLVLSRPAIDEAELRLLERGGAVLLPESMRKPWHARLRAADESGGDGLAVELSGLDNPRLVKSSAPPAAAGDQRPCCEVRMTTVGPLSPAQLAGWADGAALELAPRASLWRCAGPTEPERYLAGGRLLPWGDGWAMLIESI